MNRTLVTLPCHVASIVLTVGLFFTAAVQAQTINTIAGNGTQGYSGDSGPATAASLDLPWDVVVDAAGNRYIADFGNNRIRKVTPDGIISTIAGNGTAGYSGDGGPATSAQLSGVTQLAVDAGGNLYVADTSNNRIRKVTPGGIISTIAGTGAMAYSDDGGPATSASLFFPAGIAVDGAGNVYISDTYTRRVRKVTPDGIINTIAGNGAAGYSGDGGPAIAASLDLPFGIVMDTGGNLYIAETESARIRKVSSGGIISTVAGNGVTAFAGDGGTATSASLNGPMDVALDNGGNLYISDIGNNRIRKVSPTGVISTVAGNGIAGFSGDGGPAADASLSLPVGVATDAAGDVYIADQGNHRVRKVELPRPPASEQARALYALVFLSSYPTNIKQPLIVMISMIFRNVLVLERPGVKRGLLVVTCAQLRIFTKGVEIQAARGRIGITDAVIWIQQAESIESTIGCRARTTG